MSHALDQHDGGQKIAKRTRHQEVSRAEVAQRLQVMGREDIQTWERRSEYRSRKETLNKWKVSLIPSTRSTIFRGSFSFQLAFSELRLIYM